MPCNLSFQPIPSGGDAWSTLLLSRSSLRRIRALVVATGCHADLLCFFSSLSLYPNRPLKRGEGQGRGKGEDGGKTLVETSCEGDTTDPWNGEHVHGSLCLFDHYPSLGDWHLGTPGKRRQSGLRAWPHTPVSPCAFLLVVHPFLCSSQEGTREGKRWLSASLVCVLVRATLSSELNQRVGVNDSMTTSRKKAPNELNPQMGSEGSLLSDEQGSSSLSWMQGKELGVDRTLQVHPQTID